MICPQCQKKNKDDATFCPYCGLKFADKEVSALAEQASARQQQEFESNAQTTKSDVFSEKVTNVSKNFFTYFLTNLKSPTKQAGKIGENQFVNGYVTIGLYVLIYSLAVAMGRRIFSDFGGFFDSFFDSTFDASKLFLQTLFREVVVIGVTVVVIFVVLQQLMKIKISFHEVISRFGAYMTICLALGLLYFLFAITSLYSVQSFVGRLASISESIIVLATVYSFRNNTREDAFDPFFAALIAAGAGALIARLF
ncbi:zinc ribbon domain-containing protein [Bacillus kwashiorkori]|uniref:zinc ribbon domain-containing protein n=1 Tax=Bacillus kwashiorkori TaxID=1522318 RepID=UPI00078654AC|nr:zinc ribbon domain-containing protein [Bacillus kwashiorkori]